MPGFNGTGPRGEGPMTGGGRGYCNTSDGAPRSGGFYGRGRDGMPWGCGRGRGWGNGRGWSSGMRRGGFGFGQAGAVPPVTVDEERRYLTDQLSALENEINDIRSRLDSLNDDKK